MDAIILAGGKGTRLSAAVADVPKPLALVGSRPFLDHIVDFLNDGGAVSRIVVSAGYKVEMVQEWAAGKATVIAEPEPFGTGGGLLNAVDGAGVTGPVLVLNGDSLIRLDLNEMIASHKKSGCPVTMAVTQVPDVSQSGEVVMAGDKVSAFHEKGGENRAGWINAGIYIFEPSALKGLPRKACSLERDLMPEFLKSGIHAFRAEGAFIDIGTPENYAKAAKILGVV